MWDALLHPSSLKRDLSRPKPVFKVTAAAKTSGLLYFPLPLQGTVLCALCQMTRRLTLGPREFGGGGWQGT